MASIITATTTSGLTQSADNSGVLQLASGTGNLVTVPSVTGTAMVSGNMPAFSASTTTTQAISTSTYTKVNFPVEQFDTNNNFASSTFTPTIAGYYQLNTSVNFSGNSTCLYGNLVLYKNGAIFRSLTSLVATSVSSIGNSCLVYANGSSDYFEIYAYTTTPSVSLYGDASNNYTWFNGTLVRSA